MLFALDQEEVAHVDDRLRFYGILPIQLDPVFIVEVAREVLRAIDFGSCLSLIETARD